MALVLPVARRFYRVTSGYNPERVSPVDGVIRPHLAVDIGAPEGSPVYAVAAGVVDSIWLDDAINGNAIRLTHSGGTGGGSSYVHLQALRVKQGQRVRAGQVIGWVGHTGRATGPHLHFALREAGTPVDPAPRLEAAMDPEGLAAPTGGGLAVPLAVGLAILAGAALADY